MKKQEIIKSILEKIEEEIVKGYTINDLLSNEDIERILFYHRSTSKNYKYVEKQVFEYLKEKKCDMSGINFDNVEIAGLDFKGLTGVKINPEGRDLDNCKFNGVLFTGSFKDSSVRNVDFTDSINAVMNVQEVEHRSIAYSKMSGVTFIGSFDYADITYTDFEGSEGAIINPNKLFMEGLEGTKLAGIDFISAIENCYIDGADFTDSKNAVIIARNTPSFNDTNLNGATVIGDVYSKPHEGVRIEGATILSDLHKEETTKIKKKSIFKKNK